MTRPPHAAFRRLYRATGVAARDGLWSDPLPAEADDGIERLGADVLPDLSPPAYDDVLSGVLARLGAPQGATASSPAELPMPRDGRPPAAIPARRPPRDEDRQPETERRRHDPDRVADVLRRHEMDWSPRRSSPVTRPSATSPRSPCAADAVGWLDARSARADASDAAHVPVVRAAPHEHVHAERILQREADAVAAAAARAVADDAARSPDAASPVGAGSVADSPARNAGGSGGFAPSRTRDATWPEGPTAGSRSAFDGADGVAGPRAVVPRPAHGRRPLSDSPSAPGPVGRSSRVGLPVAESRSTAFDSSHPAAPPAVDSAPALPDPQATRPGTPAAVGGGRAGALRRFAELTGALPTPAVEARPPERADVAIAAGDAPRDEARFDAPVPRIAGAEARRIADILRAEARRAGIDLDLDGRGGLD